MIRIIGNFITAASYGLVVTGNHGKIEYKMSCINQIADFSNNHDFRITMTLEINYSKFKTSYKYYLSVCLNFAITSTTFHPSFSKIHIVLSIMMAVYNPTVSFC